MMENQNKNMALFSANLKYMPPKHGIVKLIELPSMKLDTYSFELNQELVDKLERIGLLRQSHKRQSQKTSYFSKRGGCHT